jgi:hypothetical protein
MMFGPCWAARDGDNPGEAAASDAALRWKREARPERQ